MIYVIKDGHLRSLPPEFFKCSVPTQEFLEGWTSLEWEMALFHVIKNAQNFNRNFNRFINKVTLARHQRYFQGHVFRNSQQSCDTHFSALNSLRLKMKSAPCWTSCWKNTWVSLKSPWLKSTRHKVDLIFFSNTNFQGHQLAWFSHLFWRHQSFLYVNSISDFLKRLPWI